MSSVLRSYSQIPARIKYFIANDAVEDSSGAIFNLESTIQLRNPGYPGPILTIDNFVATYSDPSGYVYPGLYFGELLKDMGQQFTITDADFNHLAIYRRVQRVRGITSEGVGGSPADSWGTLYVKVWSSDVSYAEPYTHPVLVSRTG